MSRALRVGVVLSDTVIAEHVVRSGTAFTIGQSIRNLVSLPVAGLPRRWQLLELVEGGVLLRLGPGMGARVAAGGHVLGRADLDQRGAATRTATLVTIPRGAHGKLELGEVRILFQELQLPTPAPAMALPRAVKGTLADRIDRRMAAFAAASLLVHVGVMTAATVHDGPGNPSPAERAMAQYTPDTVAIIDASDPMLADRLPLDDPDANPAPEPAAADPARPAPSTEPAPSKPPRPSPPAPVVTDPSKLRDDARAAVDALFSDDDGGRVASTMPGRKPGVDLGKQLDQVRDSNANVTIGDPADPRFPGDGQPRIGTSVKPATDGTPAVVAPIDDKDDEKVPPTRIDIIPRPPTEPVRIDAIVAKIRTTYIGGLQRCYKKALGGAPTLAGKVALSFTVTEKGKLESGSATGVDEGFEGCVEGLMSRWSFTPVTDQDGDPTEVDLGITLQLSI
jgi:hypothetical protein